MILFLQIQFSHFFMVSMILYPLRFVQELMILIGLVLPGIRVLLFIVVNVLPVLAAAPVRTASYDGKITAVKNARILLIFHFDGNHTSRVFSVIIPILANDLIQRFHESGFDFLGSITCGCLC